MRAVNPPRTQLHQARATTADAAIGLLTSPALAPIVDLVCVARDGQYEIHAPDGMVRFRRHGDGAQATYDVLHVAGRNPVANQATDRLVGVAAERALPFPTNAEHTYPYAYDHVAQLFDHPAAPDLVVLHSAAHNWEDHGGHRGEHGSLDIVQARAPFILSGAGVARRGMVADHVRLVDVGPTMCALLGATPHPNGMYLSHQDGVARTDVFTGATPRLLIGILFDGTNANVCYDLAARGVLPNVARLIENGVAFEHGAFASLPTVTLANHTTILTGAHPGHHGILHNAWYDRRTGEQVITNSQATWPHAMQHLLDGVETVHDAIHRSQPNAFTASVNEPCDRGASWSTFDYFRSGDVPPIPESPDGLPHTTERFVRPGKDYSWSSVVDHMGTEQAVGILRGHYRDITFDVPHFLWCNFTLTDSAMHEGGPYSEEAEAALRDSDARLGEILAAAETRGVLEDTAVALVADHGMEETDPNVTGDWGKTLAAAGLAIRDEGYGFLYLDEPSTGGT